MGGLLYRLGSFCCRHRWLVGGLWAGLLLLLTAVAVLGGGRTVDSFSVPGTESQRALEDLRRDLPAAAGAALTLVVRAPAGQSLDTPGQKGAVAELADRAARLPGVAEVDDPYATGRIDRTRAVGIVGVHYAHAVHELTGDERAAFDALYGTGAAGLGVVPGGLPPEERLGPAQFGGVLAAVAVLAAFGSLVATGVTLMTAAAGAGAGLAAIFAVSAVLDVSTVAPVLAVMLGLAVGLCYALLVGSRHRGNLLAGAPVEEAAARAVALAGPGVLVAGAIVVVALAGLAVLRVPFLTVIGLAAAGTVLSAVAASVTLLPALLGFAGRRVLERRGVHALAGERRQGGVRWARWVVRFRIPLLLVLVLGLTALTAPARSLRLALPDNGTAPAGSHQRVAYDEITAAFGAGGNGPLLVVVRDARGDAVSALAARVTAAVRGLVGVAAVTPGDATAAGTTRVLTVTPVSGPGSAATATLVARIRHAVEPLAGGTGTVAVTGTTAVGVDVSRTMTAALPEYLALVLGVSFLLLMFAFRSLLVPLKAAAGFLLTMGATLGLTTAVFQDGRAGALIGLDRPGPLTSFLPTVLVGVLFGLAMDYEVFLVARIRDEVARGGDATAATVAGMGRGARVVGAAGLVVPAVCGGFVLVGDPTVQAVGFGLAVGVLIDVFAVRLTLVPAVLSMLGERAWQLPRPLDLIVPRAVLAEDQRPARHRGRHIAPA